MYDSQNINELISIAQHYYIIIDNILLLIDYNINDIGYYILNLDRSNRGGTHWVCCLTLPDKIFYFDPIGIEPPKSFINEAKKLNKKIYCSKLYFQHNNERICGIYCCLFLFIVQNIYQKLNNPKDFQYILEEMKYWEIDFPKK